MSNETWEEKWNEVLTNPEKYDNASVFDMGLEMAQKLDKQEVSKLSNTTINCHSCGAEIITAK